MKKVLISLLLICTASFALSLDDVKKGLKTSSISEDSLEMKFKTTITSPMIGSQTMDTYSVRKGPNKVYFEMTNKLLSQRMILSGNKIKIIDLKNKSEKIVNNNEQIQKMMQSPNSNPMEKGNWKEPELVSGDLYRIEGDSATVYYDASKKHLVKMEQVTDKANTLTTFEYNPSTKMMSAMKISVMVGNQETKIEMVFSKYQNSKNFSDKVFDF